MKVTFNDKQVKELQNKETISLEDINEIKNVVNTNWDNVSGKVLWENPNPTENFTTQNITLNSGDYDVLVWYFYTENYITNLILEKGKNGRAIGIFPPETREWGMWIGQRNVEYINDTTYKIYQPDGVFTNYTGHVHYGYASVIVPLKIVGFKLGG